jgi:hypothetical protein
VLNAAAPLQSLSMATHFISTIKPGIAKAVTPTPVHAGYSYGVVTILDAYGRREPGTCTDQDSSSTFVFCSLRSVAGSRGGSELWVLRRGLKSQQMTLRC